MSKPRTEDDLIELIIRKEGQFKKTSSAYLKGILSTDIRALINDLKHMRGDDKKPEAA